MLQCQHCGAPVTCGEPIPRDAECPGCGRDLRACRQCRHYDPGLNNACREPMADPVVEKERRNFCEYFMFSREPFRASSGEARRAEARTRLEGLFGPTSPSSGSGRERKPGTGSSSGQARRKLEDLFRKPGPGE